MTTPDPSTHRCQVPEGDSLTISVVQFVSDLDETPVTDLPPFGRAIDLEAVEALLDQSNDGSAIEIRFQYMGYEITVDNDRTVTIHATPG